MYTMVFIIMSKYDNWSSDLPSKPGHYWFYGWPFGDTSRDPEWNHIIVRKISNGVMVIREGHFWGGSAEKAKGLFVLINFPEPPNL